MDSPLTNTIANVAGRGVGALAALSSLGQAGGLANYMFQRQRFMAEPALRATLADSPFAAGMFQVSGATTPQGRIPVAAPADFLQAGRAVAGPDNWFPRLPVLSPEQMLKVRGAQGVAAGLESRDPLVQAQAKLVSNIPLTSEELVGVDGKGGVIGEAHRVQNIAGAGSQVQLDIPGGKVVVGSPYLPGSYQTQGQAATAANVTGGLVVPDPQGGYKVVQLPAGEYATKAEADAAGGPLNQVAVPTNRGTFTLEKKEPAGVAPLPPAPPRPPPAAKPLPTAARVAPPGETPAARGVASPAEMPGAVVAAPPAAPEPEQPAGAAPALPPHEVVRQLPDGTFAPVAPPPGPQSHAAPAAPAPPLLAAASPAPSAAPYEVVSGAELGGIASGAPPAPTRAPLPSTPLPFAPATAGAPAPSAEPAGGSAAPRPAPVVPAGVPAGATKFTQQQPIAPERGGGSLTVSGDIPGGTEKPTARGTILESMWLRENNIDPANPPAGATEKLEKFKHDYDRRETEIKQDVERRYGKPDAAVADSLVRLRMFRSFVNDMLEEFSPEQRAKYVGMGGVTPYILSAAQGVRQDARFERFKSLNAALRTSVFAEAGKAVTAPELALLGPTLPSGYEATDVGYDSALRLTTEKLDKLITGYSAQTNMRAEDLTPDKQTALIEHYLSAPDSPHYGPYPWGKKDREGPTTPPSPFVVDRLYTVPPPRQ